MRARDAKELRCTRRLEAHLHRRGWRLVAGCDEAGRGALVGPLYAAAVILDPAQRIRGVDDSKKLPPEARAELDQEIRARALAFRVVAAPAADVDALNVYQASRLTMIRALEGLAPPPDFVLTDAMRLCGWGDAVEFQIPHRSIIHGDARSASIGAASILAKVARDARLRELDRLYPQRSEEHTSELQSPCNLVCRLLLEKKKKINNSSEREYLKNSMILPDLAARYTLLGMYPAAETCTYIVKRAHSQAHDYGRVTRLLLI